MQGSQPGNPQSGDGAALLDEIDSFLGQYVIYPSEHMRHAHTLWIAHTHFMDCWSSTPRIYFRSPEPGSGKTRALEVCEHIVSRGFMALSMSSAYMFRRVADDSGRPTILYDEIDTVFGPKVGEHEDIRGFINSGHRKGAVVGRCVPVGNQVITVDFPAYCAVALAGLGRFDLPDTILSRCIIVSMKKRTGNEKIKPWRDRIDGPMAAELGSRLAAWATVIKQNLWDEKGYVISWPKMPTNVEDRDADCWEALLAVADLAGGHWPETARVTAVTAVTDNREEGESQGVLLLTDLRRIFTANKRSVAKNGKPALKTPTLTVELAKVEESPWKDIRKDRSPIDARGLSVRLKPYGVKPQTIRWDDGSISKGYYRYQFEDAWKRYIVTDVTKVSDSVTHNGTNGSHVEGETKFAIKIKSRWGEGSASL